MPTPPTVSGRQAPPATATLQEQTIPNGTQSSTGGTVGSRTSFASVRSEHSDNFPARATDRHFSPPNSISASEASFTNMLNRSESQGAARPSGADIAGMTEQEMDSGMAAFENNTRAGARPSGADIAGMTEQEMDEGMAAFESNTRAGARPSGADIAGMNEQEMDEAMAAFEDNTPAATRPSGADIAGMTEQEMDEAMAAFENAGTTTAVNVPDTRTREEIIGNVRRFHPDKK